MRPIEKLSNLLRSVAGPQNYLFSLSDLSAVFPDTGHNAIKTLMARAAGKGIVIRICRGVYLYPDCDYPKGVVLFHTAAKIRAHHFNYISLESVLSDAGIISQVPTNWITVMSSGRSYTVDCGQFGHIEFIHTKKKPSALTGELSYDKRCHLWRASVILALKDMKAAKRSEDLIDWEVVDEFV